MRRCALLPIWPAFERGPLLARVSRDCNPLGIRMALLQRRLERRVVAVGIVLLLGAHLEALRAPIQYRAFQGISPVFDSLKTSERKVIACFPFPGRLEVFQNVDCMLASTRFWQPLVNGYSSFIPERYYRAPQR